MTAKIGGGGGAGVHESIVDALLPNAADHDLDELANATFIDADMEVPVSPVDQLLVALARRLLTDDKLGRAAVVKLPRSKHRSALLLAITSHLLCRRRPVFLRGPVVFIGFDMDMAFQLRSLSVQHYQRVGLATGNPLAAHRLTRVGELQPVIGQGMGDADTSLVYYNVRIGCPSLTCRSPLVVIDATSVAQPAARTRAVEWALAHNAAAIIAVGDIGDEGVVETLTAAGVVPTVLAIDEGVTRSLVHNLGRGSENSSLLSSMGVLWRTPAKVSLKLVPGDVVNEAISSAFAAIGAKPNGPVPNELDLTLNLMRNGIRLAARVKDYRTACTYNLRPGEMPQVQQLDRSVRLPVAWRNWEITSAGTMRASVRSLWREIEENNPKLEVLWKLLDELDRNTTGELLIRCHSRAAAAATRESLSARDGWLAQQRLWDRLKERITFATFKERFPPGRFAAQILTGSPPPWLFSLMIDIEADETYLLAYDAEATALSRRGQRWAQDATQWQLAACRTLHVSNPSRASSPIPDLVVDRPPTTATTLHVPGLSIPEVLDRASDSLDPPETDWYSSTPQAGGGAKICVPVHLVGGRTWWCIDEGNGGTPVLVVTVAGHEHRPVRSLRPGDQVVVPAGEGTESIHARLVSASRNNDDVRSLDLILSQFRSAARLLILSSGTRRDAISRLRMFGAAAPDQLSAWANGSTIAPREPGDVKAVFRAAGRPCPDLGLIYAVATTLRSLNRSLGRFIAAVAAGRSGEAMDRLREIVGPMAEELVDEFVIAEVADVGNSTAVGSGVAGKIR